MELTRKSPISGKLNTLELNMTSFQLFQINQGKHVQDVVPHLSRGEREFIISGITPDEWKETFGENVFDEKKG